MRPVLLLSLTPLHTMAEGGIPQPHPGLWGWSTMQNPQRWTDNINIYLLLILKSRGEGHWMPQRPHGGVTQKQRKPGGWGRQTL